MKRQLSIVRAVARQASKAKVTPTATLRCFSAINKLGFTVNNAAFTRSLSAARFSPTITRQYSTEELEIKVPGMGDAISEGTIVAWLKEIGSPVAQDDVIVQIETDKVTVDIRAPVSGKLSAQLAEAGATVRVGQDLAKIIPGAVEIPKPSAEKPKAEKQTPAPAAEQPKPAKTEAAAPQTPAKPAEPQAAPATESSQRVERRVPMSRMRQRIAQRLKDSQNTAAMLTTFNEIDMSQLMELRSSLKDEFEKKHKVKLGFMSAFVKASALALVNQPIVNAVIDGTDIVYRDYVDISVAVASPTGLVVPVLRDCQNMGFADVEKAIGSYGAKAKDGTLTIEEMQGGTFTISNGGVFGSMMGTPIINPPQSAILGMHGVQKRAVVVNDQVVVRPVMYVALTYDHRIIDGREAVTFLKKIKEYIEDPRKMLLEL